MEKYLAQRIIQTDKKFEQTEYKVGAGDVINAKNQISSIPVIILQEK